MRSDNLVGVIKNSINANPTCLLSAKVERPIAGKAFDIHLNYYVRCAKILYNLIHD